MWLICNASACTLSRCVASMHTTAHSHSTERKKHPHCYAARWNTPRASAYRLGARGPSRGGLPPPLARAEEQNPTRDALHSLVWRKLGHRLRSRLPLAPPRRAYHVDMDPSSDDYLGERTDGRTSPRARRPTDISTGAVTRKQASRTGKQDRGKTSTRTRKQKRVPSAVSTKTAEGRAFRTYLSNVGAELDNSTPQILRRGTRKHPVQVYTLF